MAEKTYIEVICYNGIEKWNKRSNALKFYRDGVRCCEGCERDRYINIVIGLEDGLMKCDDGCVNESRVYETKTNAPDGSRDYGDKTNWKIID